MSRHGLSNHRPSPVHSCSKLLPNPVLSTTACRISRRMIHWFPFPIRPRLLPSRGLHSTGLSGPTRKLRPPNLTLNTCTARRSAPTPCSLGNKGHPPGFPDDDPQGARRRHFRVYILSTIVQTIKETFEMFNVEVKFVLVTPYKFSQVMKWNFPKELRIIHRIKCTPNIWMRLSIITMSSSTLHRCNVSVLCLHSWDTVSSPIIVL